MTFFPMFEEREQIRDKGKVSIANIPGTGLRFQESSPWIDKDSGISYQRVLVYYSKIFEELLFRVIRARDTLI